LADTLQHLGGEVLGLKFERKQESTEDTEALGKLVGQLLKEREQRRKDHKYEDADKIRNWMAHSDVSVKDAAAASSAILPSGFEVRTDTDESGKQSQKPSPSDSQGRIPDD